MSWVSQFITSSIGQKLIMSLTGLFLMVFLIIHLSGNFQLMMDDGGRQFNLYAKFMTTNPVIKTVSYLLYAFILIHAVQGILLARKNRAARGNQRYAVNATENTSFAARNMTILGIIIFIFLLIHMWQFWFQMKIGAVEMIQYEGVAEMVKDLYTPVALAYSEWYFVAFYVICMIVLSIHLYQGFQSAFQTLGLSHKKYTPILNSIGILYSILIPVGFAIIPLFFYFFRT